MGDKMNPDASDLWIIYDSLAEVFGYYEEQENEWEDDLVPSSIEELANLLNRLESYE